MARGYQQHGLDITAMEMTKWFDTNYHYIVPEFTANQQFRIISNKVFNAFDAARHTTGTIPKPVLIGPVSYLLLGKEKERDFHRISLLEKLLPVYIEVLQKLQEAGAVWVQLDEPFLAMDLSDAEAAAFRAAYAEIARRCKGLKLMVATYFEGLRDNVELAVNLPVCCLHIDLTRVPQQLDAVLAAMPPKTSLSLGVVDGRNIWKNDYDLSLSHIRKAVAALGENRVMIAPSCSLLHSPADLSLETALDPEMRSWMAFARQKLQEVHELDENCRRQYGSAGSQPCRPRQPARIGPDSRTGCKAAYTGHHGCRRRQGKRLPRKAAGANRKAAPAAAAHHYHRFIPANG